MGSLVPFTPAAELIGRFRKVEVSEATVRRVSESAGQAWVELQRDEAEALELELKEAPEGPALQQLSADGAMVPLAAWGMGRGEDPGHRNRLRSRGLGEKSMPGT